MDRELLIFSLESTTFSFWFCDITESIHFYDQIAIELVRMETIILSFILSAILLCLNTIQAQKGEGDVSAAGTLLDLGTGITAIKMMGERAELSATQWLLYNKSEVNDFALKSLSFDGEKMKDMSGISVITYKIQEFTSSDDIKLDGRRQELYGFTNSGWLNNGSIDFEKVKMILIGQNEWMNMITIYLGVASRETIKETLRLAQYIVMVRRLIKV